MDAEHVGLREIKKQMTRDAIATAALKLTEQKGLNEVTVDEIAREAFVSPRTVSNYFASKEEAVLAAGDLGIEEVLEEFNSRPSEDPPLKALCELLSDYAREHPEHLRGASKMARLEHLNPTLRPFRIAREIEMVEVLSARVAARTGTNVTTDLYPSMVASAAMSALITSLAIWSCKELPDESLPSLIQDAFNMITAGYPLDRESPDPARTPV
ncbi:TetR/AcrR family transcriptional regulator [Nesterenkonia aurantiaca]|uniref:TetR/AcrR family transcriptional regulator n=1 Tax=Nesterenkonia aurantiaca TaxID=1436010 RepID=UPI003EE6B8F8